MKNILCKLIIVLSCANFLEFSLYAVNEAFIPIQKLDGHGTVNDCGYNIVDGNVYCLDDSHGTITRYKTEKRSELVSIPSMRAFGKINEGDLASYLYTHITQDSTTKKVRTYDESPGLSEDLFVMLNSSN